MNRIKPALEITDELKNAYKRICVRLDHRYREVEYGLQQEVMKQDSAHAIARHIVKNPFFSQFTKDKLGSYCETTVVALTERQAQAIRDTLLFMEGEIKSLQYSIKQLTQEQTNDQKRIL